MKHRKRKGTCICGINLASYVLDFGKPITPVKNSVALLRLSPEVVSELHLPCERARECAERLVLALDEIYGKHVVIQLPPTAPNDWPCNSAEP